MIILNNTAQDVGWDGSWEGGGDCGTLGAGQSFDQPGWKNMTITVDFNGLPDNLDEVTPFAIEVNETGTGTAVTIGLYYE
jgi:hypothetical protein